MASKLAKRCAAKFRKLAALNSAIDCGVQGAAKAKSRMSEDWRNRKPNNVAGFYYPKKAKALA